MSIVSIVHTLGKIHVKFKTRYNVLGVITSTVYVYEAKRPGAQLKMIDRVRRRARHPRSPVPDLAAAIESPR